MGDQLRIRRSVSSLPAGSSLPHPRTLPSLSQNHTHYIPSGVSVMEMFCTLVAAELKHSKNSVKETHNADCHRGSRWLPWVNGGDCIHRAACGQACPLGETVSLQTRNPDKSFLFGLVSARFGHSTELVGVEAGNRRRGCQAPSSPMSHPHRVLVLRGPTPPLPGSPHYSLCSEDPLCSQSCDAPSVLNPLMLMLFRNSHLYTALSLPPKAF